jgi:HAD superfamily hydrolase (TIGR01509 family)
MTGHALRLAIFDCDGVLIDSEPLSQKMLADEAASYGWAMTEAEMRGLTGLNWSALKPIFEARLDRVLPADWPATMQSRLIPLLAENARAMPGAKELLRATAALGLPYRVASNSSHQEMDQKFAVTGLLPLVRGRVHSARDVARSKPAPDVFLAAAAAECVSPEECIVVEDSVPGIAAAHAAGMRVIAYAPHGFVDAEGIRAPHGVVRSLADLPPLFEAALG